jgi:hypothetical protein
MRILGLDISTKCGWALGSAGEKPRIDVERLRPKGMKDEDGDPVGLMDRVQYSAEHMGGFIRDICFLKDTRPDLIVYEAAILPFVPDPDDESSNRKTPIMRNMDSILTPIYAIGAIHGLGPRYGIEVLRVANSTWMKHYTGKARHGSRAAGKAAALKRGIQLGYLPPNCRDTDMSDAVGVWDWAAYKFGRRAVEPGFQLFEQGSLRHG